MAECTCPYTPEETWLSAASCGYGSGYEPGSMKEWNPDCPVHPARGEIAEVLRAGIGPVLRNDDEMREWCASLAADIEPLLDERVCAAVAGIRLRIEVACDGYENLLPSDVPGMVVAILPTEAWIAGAASAARQIRDSLTRPDAEEAL